eukprot:7382872-Prymnesium_polylepis.1
MSMTLAYAVSCVSCGATHTQRAHTHVSCGVPHTRIAIGTRTRELRCHTHAKIHTHVSCGVPHTRRHAHTQRHCGRCGAIGEQPIGYSRQAVHCTSDADASPNGVWCTRPRQTCSAPPSSPTPHGSLEGASRRPRQRSSAEVLRTRACAYHVDPIHRAARRPHQPLAHLGLLAHVVERPREGG